MKPAEELARICLAALPPSVRAAVVDTSTWKGLPFAGRSLLSMGGRHFPMEGIAKAVAAVIGGGQGIVRDNEGRRARVVFHRETSDVWLEFENARCQLSNFLLTAAAPDLRSDYLHAIRKEFFLGTEAQVFAAQAATRQLTPSEALDFAGVLASSPESYLWRLQELAESRGDRTVQEMEWTDIQGLATVFGPPDEALTAEGLSVNAGRSRKARLEAKGAADLPILLSSLAHSGWRLPALPRNITSEVLLEATFPDGELGDPFAILALLSCVQRAPKRFADITLSVHARLQALQPHLARAFKVFSAAFLANSSALACGAEARMTPVAWRWACAFLSAGLTARTFARYQGPFADDLYRSMSEAYKTSFDISVALDAREAPRWQAHFATPAALHGHWLGRFWRVAHGLSQVIDDGRALLELAEGMARDLQGQGVLTMLLPGPLGGGRTRRFDDWKPSDDLEAGVLNQDLSAPEQWRSIANLIAVHPPTSRTVAYAIELFKVAPPAELLDSEGELAAEVTGLCHLIAHQRDHHSSELLLTKMLDAIGNAPTLTSVTRAFFNVVALAATHFDAEKYGEALREGLGRLVFRLRSRDAAERLERLINLTMDVRPDLTRNVAPARAAAVLLARSA